MVSRGDAMVRMLRPIIATHWKKRGDSRKSGVIRELRVRKVGADDGEGSRLRENVNSSALARQWAITKSFPQSRNLHTSERSGKAFADARECLSIPRAAIRTPCRAMPSRRRWLFQIAVRRYPE